MRTVLLPRSEGGPRLCPTACIPAATVNLAFRRDQGRRLSRPASVPPARCRVPQKAPTVCSTLPRSPTAPEHLIERPQDAVVAFAGELRGGLHILALRRT
jgi:hypothetical protein